MSKFIYLLNTLENAAQASDPSTAGYGLARQAVLEYVAKLEAGCGEAPPPLAAPPMPGRYNVVIGERADSQHSYCVVIGAGARSTKDYEIVIGTSRVAVSREMTQEEFWLMYTEIRNLFSALHNPERLLGRVLDIPPSDGGYVEESPK